MPSDRSVLQTPFCACRPDYCYFLDFNYELAVICFFCHYFYFFYHFASFYLFELYSFNNFDLNLKILYRFSFNFGSFFWGSSSYFAKLLSWSISISFPWLPKRPIFNCTDRGISLFWSFAPLSRPWIYVRLIFN